MTILGIFYARFLPQEGWSHTRSLRTNIIRGCRRHIPRANSDIPPPSSLHLRTSERPHTNQPLPGTKIVAQSPPGCIVPVPSVQRAPLFDFDVLQEYIIPRKAFCNRFVAATDPDGRYTVLGFPVLIAHSKYKRNEFIFNFGIVVGAGDEGGAATYERVVRRLAATFAEMERQSEYLSQEHRAVQAGRRPIEGLLEIVKEDLNNYGECMIPIGEFFWPFVPPFSTLVLSRPSLSITLVRGQIYKMDV